MRIKTVGNKGDKVLVIVRNAETVSIPRGTPVVLNMNGTNDGLDVVLPTSSSLGKSIAFRYGVVTTDLQAAQIGEAQVYGVCDYVLLTLQTRANTSGGSSFSTAQTVALGELLTIFTAGNAFSTIASTIAAASSDAQTLSNYVPINAIGQSLASAAGVATTTSNTLTIVTQAVKAFLRMM